MKLVEAALKGAPFEKKLVGKTYDGLRIEPLYARASGASAIPARAQGRPWQIVQRIDHPDPAAANAQALVDLENGATGLALVLGGAIGSYGFGLNSSDQAIARALDGVHLDAGVAIEVDAGPHAADAARALAALVKRRGASPSTRSRIAEGVPGMGQQGPCDASPKPGLQLGLVDVQEHRDGAPGPGHLQDYSGALGACRNA